MKRYTKADHLKAYQVWRQKGSYSAVTDALGIRYSTVRKWAQVGFRCGEGCPYHGWEELVERETRERAGMVQLAAPPGEEESQEQLPEPLLSDGPIEDVSPQATELTNRQELLSKVGRSDIERASDLDFLYCQLYYHLTGMAVPCESVVDASGKPVPTKELVMSYEQGKKPKTLGEGVGALLKVVDRIQDLKRDAGVYAQKTGAQKAAEEAEEVEQMTADEARRMYDLIQQTPPDKLKYVLEQLDSENKFLASVAGSSDQPSPADSG